MNSEENNQKQIDKLSRLEKIYADSEKHESVIDRIDADEDFCAPLRRVVKWIVLIIWVACVFVLFTGGDFTITASGILFSAAVYIGLCIPKFLHEKKKGDVIVAIIATVGCLALAIILLTAKTTF